MPAKTLKQQRFMYLASTPEGRKKLKQSGKEVPPKKVANEFKRLAKNKKK